MKQVHGLAHSRPSVSASNSQRAFTLIDLMVILCVLTLLGLVLLPAMATSAERSQRARCQDNLRRIAMGVTIYAGNNGGRIFVPRSIGSAFIQLAIDPPNATGANSVGLSLATNGVWTCPSRPGLPVYEPVYPQYSIGYQYFGGISTWQNPGYSGPSRSPTNLNTAQPHWALVADAVVKVNGLWGGNEPGREFVYANIPPHRAENSTVPQGGNQAFVDGSVQWIQAEKMYSLSSWSPTQRGCYWYQDPKDFPAALKNFLPSLRFQP